MESRKKSYSLHFVGCGNPEQVNSVIKGLVKESIQKVLDKHGAIAYNLDEVLDEYISEEKHNGDERRSSLREGIDTKRLAEG
ncbi:hypothetical protein [Paenibacillus sp. Marseille-Q4541]|uniref:hypothetical protein n=1 Tax=Paenibacillus sp. Marseille-Q4541 TaxID=2831522 RepID=UPI001BAE0701|nr:hypothetical protein [Paenibacillus sp. Marseille-Q4541]